jgi:hypothetical protein
MKTHSVILAAAALLISGSIASAQQLQYDSLGSPTPAPNQNASPNATAPNVPNTGGVSTTTTGDRINADGNDKTGAGANGARSATTGAGGENGGMNGPVNTGTTTPTDSNTGVATPGGLTND